MNILEIRGAVKSYSDNVKILKNLNLSVQRGSIYSLIGASGAGKTTILSCILGMIQLDNGEIKIFGQILKPQSRKFSHLIGFMPQDLSLVRELTIIEMLSYFANINEMKMSKFHARFALLMKTLCLPNGHRLIGDCSGGEKRRISLAAAIIHDPLLVLLDEPTVGVDPLLREKIWNFIRKTTDTYETTFIITTHYVDEALKSNQIGMIRNGKLLFQKPPNELLQIHNTTKLDDVIMRLCESSENNSNDDNFEVFDFESVNEERIYHRDWNRRGKKLISMQRIMALVMKELLVIKREPIMFIVILILPFLTIYNYSQAFGTYPENMSLGIVNGIKNCNKNNHNYSHLLPSESCHVNNIECCITNEIYEKFTKNLIFYESLIDAMRVAKKGKLIAIIDFSLNATLNVMRKVNNENFDYFCDVYIDNTNLHLSMYTKDNLLKAFERCMEKILDGCEASLKLANVLAMNFEEPIFGSTDADFKNSTFPVIVVIVLMTISCGFTCLCLIEDRNQGIWNRSLLAGVSLGEILFSHILVQLAIMLIQLTGIVFMMKLYAHFDNSGSYLLTYFLLLAVYFTGMTQGLLLSCLFDSFYMICYVVFGISQFHFYFANTLWPLEGMHPFAKYFVKFLLPATLPNLAYKDILMKNYDLTHSSIYFGFLSSFLWISFHLMFSFVALKYRKFYVKK